MQTAFCFSGELRSIDKTISLIKTNVVDSFDSTDVFVHLWEDDPNIHKLKYLTDNLNVVDIVTEPRITFDEKAFASNKREEVNIQGFLRQLYCLRRCNEQKRKQEEKQKTIYDIVCRIRPDILINPDTRIESMIYDLNKIYVPRHDAWYGQNDRLYFGSSTNMDILSNRIDFIDDYYTYGGCMHYETFLLFVATLHEIEFDYLSVEFGLLRDNGNYIPPTYGIPLHYT